jgi:hypothetical protein
MHDWLSSHYDVLKDFAGPAISLASLLATIIFAIIGFSTFGRWRREQLEGRRIDVVTLPPGIDPTRIRVWPDRGPDDEAQEAH